MKNTKLFSIRRHCLKQILTLVFVFVASIGYSQNINSNQIVDTIIAPIDSELLHSFCGTINTGSSPIIGTALNPNVPSANNTSPGIPIQKVFIPTSIETCGKIQFYYFDIDSNTNVGFDDPVLGTQNRAVLCAVANYLQSVFDFSGVPNSNLVKILVDRSYTVSNPPPVNFVAAAGPYYDFGTTLTGFVKNNFEMHVNNYSGYTSNVNYTKLFDARLEVNFPAAGFNLNIDTPSNCTYDLYMVLLHEMIHSMGFISAVGIDSNNNIVHRDSLHNGFPLSSNTFTTFDKFFNYFDNTVNNGLSLSKIVDNTLFKVNHLNYADFKNRIWVNGQNLNGNNHPIYSGSYAFNGESFTSMFTHMDRQFGMYNNRGYVEPGFRENYIMGPFVKFGEYIHDISMQEIRMMMDLGYSLNPVYDSIHSFLATNSNKPPQAKTPIKIDNYNPSYDNFVDAPVGSAYQHVNVDFTISNNNTSLLPNATQLVINLNDPAFYNTHIYDINNNAVAIVPSSIIGIRGVGIGGNNHNCLAVDSTNSIITYTPRPNFIGRALFMVQLNDGYENGGELLLAIDVLPGTNFNSIVMGDELVLNGDFEEGTEVRDNVHTKIGNNEFNYITEGLFYNSTNFSDCHPYSYINVATQVSFYAGGPVWARYFPYNGTIIRNSFSTCTTLSPSFGLPQSDFNFNYAYGQILNPNSVVTNSTNNRYELSRHYTGGLGKHCFNTMAIPFKTSRFYKLEYDFFMPNKLTINNVSTTKYLNNEISFTNLPFYESSNACIQNSILLDSVFIQTGTWQHIVDSFYYCPDTMARYFHLGLHGDFGVASLYAKIDNISVIERPLPANLFAASAVDSIICANQLGDSVQLLATFNHHVHCNFKYKWTPSNSLNYDTVFNPLASPTVTTTYTVIATDANYSNNTFSSIVTVFIKPVPNSIIGIASLCVPPFFKINSTSVDTPLVVNVLDINGNMLTTYNSVPDTYYYTSGLSYIVTVTNTFGCTQRDTITPIANPATITGGHCLLTELVAHPPTNMGTGYTYQWQGPNLTVTNQVNSPLPLNNQGLGTIGDFANNVGQYTVTVTDGMGCTASSTYDVSLGPINTTITANPITVPCGGSVALTGQAGACCNNLYPIKQLDYNGPAGVTFTNPFCNNTAFVNPFNCNTNAGPITSTSVFAITATDVLGCTATKTQSVAVTPLQVGVGVVNTGNFCSGASYNLLITGGNIYTITPGNIVITNASSNIMHVSNITANAVYTITSGVGACASSITALLAGVVLGNNFCTCANNLATNSYFTYNYAAGNNAAMDAEIIAYNSGPNVPIVRAQSVTAYTVGSTAGVTNLFISGAFSLVKDMVFVNCKIKMIPYYVNGVNITEILTNGYNLTIQDNTTIEGCTEMWQGITTNATGTGLISVQNSTLADMLKGVSIFKNNKINAYNSSFTDNNNSIYFESVTNPANCVLEKNTIKKLNGLKIPLAAQLIPKRGIYLRDCGLTIGSYVQGTLGNTFDNLQNGVYLEYYGGFKAKARVNIVGNHFTNITSTGNFGGNTFTTTRGCAVYAMGAQLYSAQTIFVELNTFDNCDKAAIFRKVHVGCNYNNIQNTKAGILCTQVEGKSLGIAYNTINNTLLGVFKNGDENYGTTINFNNITLSTTMPASLLGNSYVTVPTAIYTNYGSYINMGYSVIANNQITIPNQDHGIGISMYNGSGDEVRDNNINFTNNAVSTFTNFAIPDMLGIYSNNNKTITMTGNLIDNNYQHTSSTSYLSGNNAGIYLTASKDCKLQCNTANYMRHGIFAVANNGSATAFKDIAGNTLRTSQHNVLLWHLGTHGSIGENIGINLSALKFDANNSFLGTSTTKVHRVLPTGACSTAYNNNIVTTTNKLVPSQSTSSNGGSQCAVIVKNPNISETFTCTTTTSGGGGNDGTKPLDIVYAKRIARNEIDYTELDEGARRMDREQLYACLEENDSIRLSDPVLDSFYLANFDKSVAQLNAIDNLIAELSDTALLQDNVQWQVTFETAKSLNNSLSSYNTLFETNAKNINVLYFNSLDEGIDALNEEQIEQIQTLAQSCPYISGNAVYRARELAGNFGLAQHYDDLVICNSQGMYKTTSTSNLQKELDELNNKANGLYVGEIAIYPNPAHDYLNVKYNFLDKEDAVLELYNNIGQLVQKVMLNGQLQLSVIKLKKLTEGIYHYHIKNKNGNVHNGKVLIE